MNALEAYILDHHLDPLLAMNLLQEHGIVSDNAIWAGDVAAADHAAGHRVFAQKL